MPKHRRSNGRRRGVNTWEVYWVEGNRQHLVQENSFAQVIKRMDRLALMPWVSRSGWRQVAGKPPGR